MDTHSVQKEVNPKRLFGLFARVLSEKPHAQHFAYLTSGWQAARDALEIVQRRRQAARMLLLRPQIADPDMTGLDSPVAAAESARWALLSSGQRSTRPEGKLEPINVAKMPKGCTVMFVYLAGDQEDEVLQKALKAAEVNVEVRRLSSIEDGIVSATLQMFGGAGPSTTQSASEEDSIDEYEQTPSESQSGFSEFESPSAGRDMFSKQKLVAKLNRWAGGVVSRLPLLFGSQDEEQW